MTADLNDYIARYMPRAEGTMFDVEPLSEYPMVDWDEVPFAPPEQMMQESKRRHPSMPRVVPPEREAPGVKDHSVIKSILRRSGLL